MDSTASGSITNDSNGNHDSGRPRSRRPGVIAALGAIPVLIVGAIVLMGAGGDADTIATDLDTTTTAAVSTTTSPVFIEAPATTTASTVKATTTTVAATTSTTIAATTTVAPITIPETLPQQETQPIAPPPDPRGFENQVQLGSISIPKLGVSEPLLEGIRLTTLDNGPGHWPGTAMPGEIGNVVVAGHRTSHGAPFRNLDQLVPGDVVEFDTGGGVVTYTVTGTQIVTPDAVWIVNPTDTPTATLFACHPPGSTRQRIVVNLELS